MSEYATQPCPDLRHMKGLSFPADVKFRHVLVTGPPGAGKSTLILQLGGWSEEGYLDLSRSRWWTDQALAFRPREIHLGFPFVGFEQALAVFDPEWLEATPHPQLDLARIQIPPPKRTFLSPDWRKRYVFEFLLPPAEVLFEQRSRRAEKGTHPVDFNLSLELVKAQIDVFRRCAVHLSRNGVRVYLREGTSSPPICILGAGDAND
ncbi:MAG: ATP-binding protein [Sedimenticolaceae bacterium]